MKTPTNIQQAFADWKAFTARVHSRAERLDNSIHEQGWALAASVGIPRDMCCLHNASIDDKLTGWCYQNPERLRVARRANHLVNQWNASRIADRIVKTAWNKLIAEPFGYAAYRDIA